RPTVPGAVHEPGLASPAGRHARRVQGRHSSAPRASNARAARAGRSALPARAPTPGYGRRERSARSCRRLRAARCPPTARRPPTEPAYAREGLQQLGPDLQQLAELVDDDHQVRRRVVDTGSIAVAPQGIRTGVAEVLLALVELTLERLLEAVDARAVLGEIGD